MKSFAIVLFVVFVLPTSAAAQQRFPPILDSFTQQAFLTDATALTFGYSASLSSDGNTALIGSVAANVGSNFGQGAAYVFTRNGGSWTEQARLTAPTFGSDLGYAFDAFGVSVALSADGNTAVVGALNKAVLDSGPPGLGITSPTLTRPGGVFVFTRNGNTWNKSYFIQGPVDGEGFGVSVAISGNATTILVGATYDGKAYVFVGPVPTSIGPIWARQDTWPPNYIGRYTNFGGSGALSADGSVALVGADGANVAIVFTRSGSSWTQQQVLMPPTSAGFAGFGFSVALTPDGRTALVGADREGSNAQGAAYVFTSNGSLWSQRARLSASVGAPFDQFGYSVALGSNGTTALVGAPEKTVGSNTRQGAAYGFTATGNSWSLERIFTAPAIGPNAGAANDGFGLSVALPDGVTALIAAPGRTVDGNANQGAAYVFVRMRPLDSILTSLANLISSSNLPPPIQSQLLSLLQQIATFVSPLTPGNKAATIANLQAFIVGVRQAQSLALIPAPQAYLLISGANQVIALLPSF